MANTYTQLYVQLVFAVSARMSLIQPEWKEALQQYFTALVQQRSHKLIVINCMPDHTHILVGLHPTQAISDLVEEIKAVASKLINDRRWVMGHFEWQEGYGAFSYSHSQLDRVVKYIKNQEHHHAKKSFREEYIDFLDKFKVPHDARYIFKDLK